MYMGDYVEISAKTVEDAVTEALIKLQTTSDKLEYESSKRAVQVF